ncbi:MAG: hypothetical protein ACOCZ7_02615, partial [Armatimonadota bacterium]
MAVETLTPRITLPDRPGLCARHMERIARATFSGRRRAASAIVESAGDLLCAEAAVLLRPTDTPEVLAATWAADADEAPSHELWEPGPQAPRLLDRTCHSTGGWREPWSGLRMKLQGLGIRSWAAIPLHEEGRCRPLGSLIVGARRASSRPCAHLHRLPDFALSATTALAAAFDSEPAEIAGPGNERLQTVSNLAFGVSHTLGNIFGAIIGNLQFLQEEMPSEKARELIDWIERSTADGIGLMRSLQAYTAIPAEAAMQALDLSEMVRETAALTRGLIGHWPSHQRVQIETELEDAAPAWGDVRQLRE